MYFSKFVVLLWFSALFTSAGMGCAFAADGLRPYTIDDALKLEATGSGLSCGGKVIWEQAPPYDQIGEYSFSHIGAWSGSGFKLKSIPLNGKKGAPSPLVKQDEKTNYFLNGCSSDGRFVVYYAVKESDVSLGAYDFKRRVNTAIRLAPVVGYGNRAQIQWISPEEFVVAAYKEGDKPFYGIARPHVRNTVFEAGKRAWGGGLSADVLDNRQTDHGSTDGPKWRSGQVYRVNVRSGKARLLANGLFESLKISHDGRYLAALRQADLPPQDPQKPNTDWTTSQSKLVVFDLKKGGAPHIVAPKKDVFIETLAWAPYRNKLAFFAWEEGAGVRSGIYHAYDADADSLTPYPHNGLDLASERERGYAQKPERVMWVDGRLAVFAREYDGASPRFTYRNIYRPGGLGDPGKADWFLVDAKGKHENLTARFVRIAAVPLHADAGTLTVLADGNVWRLAPGAEPENLTAGVEANLVLTPQLRYSTQHRPFKDYGTLASRGEQGAGFAIINFETGAVTEVTSPGAGAEFIAASEKGAVLFESTHAGGIDLILQDGAQQQTIDRLNRHMAGVRALDWTPFSYEAETHAGKETLTGCVLLPHGHDTKKQYPVIVSVYPNSGDSCTRPNQVSQKNRILADLSGDPQQLLAAKGYIIFTPNLRREVIRTPEGPLAGMPAMVDAGIAALVSEGYADPDRVGVWGFSQGGFSSLWVASQSDHIKAAVSLNGWADMYSHYFDASYYKKVYRTYAFRGSAQRYEATSGSDFGIGKTPYEALDTYVRQSPLFHAPAFKAPVLLIHSDMDTFNLAQYEKMYTALNLQNKPARFVRYWGEGHSPSSPENMRHMWGEIFDWFDEYLGGPEPTEQPTQH